MKTRMQELVSDEEVEKAFMNTNFGSQTPRDVIKSSLLKVATVYSTGHTAKCILSELGLITVAGKSRVTTLTRKGKEYLYEAFC